MDDNLRKEFFKVFYIASFLFITIFFVLPYLIQISTYFHERGHQDALAKYGINSTYDVDLLSTIPNFYNPNVAKLGVTQFDLDKYLALDKYQRMDINIAGIVSDLKFLFLIAIYLALVNVYTFYKVKIRGNDDLTWILAVNWILFMWMLALVQITVANITYNTGDISHLISFLRV